mgnify:CR=1 FL=1
MYVRSRNKKLIEELFGELRGHNLIEELRRSRKEDERDENTED